MKAMGSVEITCYKNGKVEWIKNFRNLMTEDAFKLLLHHVKGTSSGTYNTNVFATHLALGIDDTAPSESDVDLGDEKIRKTLDSSTVNETTLVWEGQMFLDNNEGNGETYKEIGLFTDDDPPGGLMLGRLLVGSIQKTSDIELRFKYNIEFSNKV